MSKKNLLLLSLASLACASAFAQASLGTVTKVQGVVSASQGTTGMAVAPGTVVQNGMRFVTTSSGSVTLSLNSGCTVVVPPAHAVTVLQSMTCQQLTAAVQPSTTYASQAGAGSNTAVVNGVIAVGAVGVAAGVLSEVTDDNNNISGR